jgi:hypothetical protein
MLMVFIVLCVSHLRKFNSSIVDANVNNCAIIFEADKDFGDVSTTDVAAMTT